MPCHYRFVGDGILVCVFEGEYTLAETMEIFRRGLDDPQAAGGTNVIIDVTGSRAVKTAADFRRVVKALRDHDRFAGRIAVVASADDPLRYGLSRQFSTQTSLGGVPMEVFESISGAQVWLSGEPDAADPDAAPQ